MKDKYIVLLDGEEVETTTSEDKARYYADGWYELFPGLSLEIKKL